MFGDRKANEHKIKFAKNYSANCNYTRTATRKRTLTQKSFPAKISINRSIRLTKAILAANSETYSNSWVTRRIIAATQQKTDIKGRLRENHRGT